MNGEEVVVVRGRDERGDVGVILVRWLRLRRVDHSNTHG